MNQPSLAPPPFLAKLQAFAADIKLSHSIFALPFALLSTVLAAKRSGGLQVGQVVLIVTCMVTARTVAMAVNRYVDAAGDAKNPRTARRAIPAGRLSRPFVAGTILACAAAFVLATAGFWWLYANPWPLALAVPVLAYLSVYPFLKRFTALCHFYLGTALALAPVCAWLAVAGTVAAPPLWMAAAVVLWTAGFDIIYACQDYAHDVAHGVFSVPARLGIAGALWVARFAHAACVVMFLTLGWATPQLGVLYWAGVAIAVALLVIEHAMVRPDDLSKVGLAFFTVNGIISLLLGTLGIADVLLGPASGGG
jgi:4-hydroxybenzoate polyprenyltransferase